MHGDVMGDRHLNGLWLVPTRPEGMGELVSSFGVQPVGPTFRRWLPIYILPLGFTLNTLFYAAAWFICLFGIRSIRHALRARRGLCTRCAYDLKGLPPGSPCPECGRLPLRATHCQPATATR
ncbi:MAG: hypothetical protein U0638_15565 [Phycisphaerales bacterium]